MNDAVIRESFARVMQHGPELVLLTRLLYSGITLTVKVPRYWVLPGVSCMLQHVRLDQHACVINPCNRLIPSDLTRLIFSGADTGFWKGGEDRVTVKY